MERSDKLSLLSKFPYCAETPNEYLGDEKHFFTPNKEMFERNHNLIPVVDIEDFELELLKGKDDEEPMTLSFDEIKAMPSVHL